MQKLENKYHLEKEKVYAINPKIPIIENKKLLEVLNQEKIDIDYFKSCLKAFTPIEIAVLRVLNDSTFSLTTKQIRARFIRDVYQHMMLLTKKAYIESLNLNKNRESKNEIKNIENELKKKENNPMIYISLELAKIDIKRIIKQLDDYQRNILNNPAPPSIRDEAYYTIFSKNEIKIPSVPAIKNAISEIMPYSIITKREVKSKKVDAYYYLNPKFDVFFKRFKEVY